MNDTLDLLHKTDTSSPNENERRGVSHALTRERNVRPLSRMERLLRYLSPGERLLLYILTFGLAASTMVLLATLNTQVSAIVPSFGGSLIEGTVGTPRFINPLLAISQTDQDLSMLVYSGLMRPGVSGDSIPDLASGYEVSEDGTTYTFYIREDATFHDGTKVTAEDVVFTVQLAQNQDIKSPRRVDWEGVSATAQDEHVVIFTLPHAYAPFLETTQLGILPKHLWGGILPDEFPFHTLNTHPIGSGPYRIEEIISSDVGTPLSYELSSFEEFALGRPHIESIMFKFYSNEDVLMTAFNEGAINSFASISADSILRTDRPQTHMVRAPSTRIFAIFFNQNHASVLAETAVRNALSNAIDRNKLVQDILGGFGLPVTGPIPPGLLGDTTEASSSLETSIDAARATLTRAGWAQATSTATAPDATKSLTWTKKNARLSFALATADTPELVATAQAVAADWRALGVEVNVQVYPLTEFNATVLRPRAYDAVLFGEVVGRTLDLFAFWHSSQRNDPGLNLAQYANSTADRALTSARTELDRADREKLYKEFAAEIAKDNPAVFLYAPEFLYVVPEDVQNVVVGPLTTPSERFLQVYDWYTDTERVWEIFNK